MYGALTKGAQGQLTALLLTSLSNAYAEASHNGSPVFTDDIAPLVEKGVPTSAFKEVTGADYAALGPEKKYYAVAPKALESIDFE